MALLLQQQQQLVQQESSSIMMLKRPMLSGETQDDEDFWNQDIFQDGGGDDEFDGDDDAIGGGGGYDDDDDEDDSDSVDSDFFESESDDEQREADAMAREREIDRLERQQKRAANRARANRYVDPAAVAAARQKKKKKRSEEKVVQKRGDAAVKEESDRKSGEVEVMEADGEGQEGRSVKRRKSNRVSVIRHREMVERRLEVEEEKQAIRRVRRVKRASKRAESNREPTQEEKLQEAQLTAIYNRESLKHLIATEEDRLQRQRDARKRQTYTGPVVRFRSNDDGNTLAFTHVHQVPSVINARYRTPQDLDPLDSKWCVVYSEKTARYRDPLTKMPYSCVDAFRIVRDCLNEFQTTHGPIPPQTAIVSHNNSHTQYLLRFKDYVQQYTSQQS